MGNMCCRRVVGYSPNGVEVEVGRFQTHQQHQQGDHHQQQKGIISAPMSAYHSAGDDCAINELLEGRMDLDVILPDNRKVRLTVERRTPMMDLLVQAASATKISPAGHTIHVFGDNGKGSGTLHYKPSTPIGSLDANTICIVPKKDAQDSATGKRAPKTANRPFEPTFRVQVHLPRNQLTVARVSPRVTISELRSMVCKEKGLDTGRYQLVRPSDPGQPLSGDTTLAEYGSTEITLLSNTCIESHICNSTSHIMPYPKRVEEQKKKTGILRLLAEDANHKVYTKTHLNGTATTHRPAPTTIKTSTEPPHRFKPKKRRPAPPPPPQALPEPPFHSRQSSSDSSGYHEATSSYLREDHCASVDEKASSDSSGVSSLDAKLQPMPVGGVVSNPKKRKAPPPPPIGEQKDEKSWETELEDMSKLQLKDNKEETIEKPSHVVEEQMPIAEKEERQTVDHLQKKTELPEREVCEDDERGSVTKVALVALNARLEQDVTGREIASSIQAAFHSLEQRKSEPSLLAIKRRDGPINRDNHRTDSVKKTPEDTLSQRSEDKPINLQISSVRVTPKDTTGLHKSYVSVKVEDRPQKTAVGDVSTNSFQLKKSVVSLKPDYKISVTKNFSRSQCAYNEGCSTPDKNLPKSLSTNDAPVVDTRVNSNTLQKSSVRLNFESKESADDCLEAFPPPPSEFRSDEKSASQSHSPSTPSSKALRRSSSLLNLTNAPLQAKLNRSRTLQRSLSDLSLDDKGEFEAEQERLQREYVKLQRQFILWQQQLMSNHAMLSEECLVPQYARTLRQSHSLPEGEDYSSDGATISCPLVSRSLSYEPTKDRSSTLPRSTINIPSLEFGSTTMVSNGSSTLRSSKTKSYFKPPQVRVSTKNRQRLPPEIRKDGELDIYDDAKILSTILPSFDSLKLISENEDAEVLKVKNNKLESLRNNRNQVDAGSTVLHLKNNAQATRLERLLNGEDSSTTVLHLKNGNLQNGRSSNGFGNHSENLLKKEEEVKKIPPPVPNKTSSLPKHIFGQNLNGHCFKIANGDTGQARPHCETVKVNGVSDPPPPPPLPVNGQVNGRSNNIRVPSGLQRKMLEKQVDPREQLMQEIRKCGGRTALRKISLDMVS